MNRRQFLKLAGLSTAVAAEGCAPKDRLKAYVVPPTNARPGVTQAFATVCRECPAGCGLIALVRDGRAIKVDGNPDHPVNTGKLCIRGQSSLQGLYNPDRFTAPHARDDHGRLAPITWDEAERRLGEAMAAAKGKRVVWIGQVETGPMDRLTDEWLAAMAPDHRKVRYEPLSYDALRTATAGVFGTAEFWIPQFRIEAARTLVSFGADFLETWLSNVEYARGFGEWRRARREGRHGGRFVFIAPRLSMTGANADEWIAIKPGTEAHAAEALRLLVSTKGGAAPAEVAALCETAGVPVDTMTRLAREFASGPSLAFPPGEAQNGHGAVAAHAAVLRLNAAAGNIGRTVFAGEPHAISKAAFGGEMAGLIAAMNAGTVGAVLIHGANPVFTLPPASGFAEALKKVPVVVSFSPYPDETAALATLVLPDHHFLESWGEYSPRPGADGLIQPVVAPVADTRATGDVLLSTASRAGHGLGATSFQQYVRKAHAVDETAWAAMLQRGGEFNEPKRPGMTSTASAPAAAIPAPQAPASGQLALHVFPTANFYDGRTANRPWAQEIPEPMSKSVWGSWGEIHPDTAKAMGVTNGDVILLESPQGRLEVPALVTDRVAPNVIAVPMGQGHTAMGGAAQGKGVNPMALLPAAAGFAALPTGSTLVRARKLPLRRPLVILQTSVQQVTENIARGITLAQFGWLKKKGPEESPHERKHASLYKNPQKAKYHWGMAIDLDQCIGCNACVASCYAENNVPIVGKTECSRGRHMGWLSIQNYGGEAPTAEGLIQIQRKDAGGASGTGPRTLQTRFLPMLCQQCQNAPCEYVCPVDATVHSPEGLNQQAYNRCVGTRYCSNNCPYKVRRFNWYHFKFVKPLDMQLNPEVTVRSKGVMEKCTFCVQRIEHARVEAKIGKRSIGDGDIVTACQAACPTDAIVFGDLNDPNSRVAKLAEDARGYGVLEQLNTYPNITYLARVRAE